MYDHVSSEYSRLDFDGADDFMLFFASKHTVYLNPNCVVIVLYMKLTVLYVQH